jgi:hypothetical protein
MSLVTELYDVNEPEWWGKSDISSKEQYKIGTILRDEKGNRAIITGYNTETQQPIYQVIK